MTKLLIIAPRFPYPLEKGDKLRLYHQIKTLSSHFSIHLAAISDLEVKDEHKDHLLQFCDSCQVFRINGKLNALKSMLNKDAFQVSYFYSTKVHREIQRYHDQIMPDVIYYQLFRTHKYQLDSLASKLIDLMDCFSFGYDARAQESGGLKSLFYEIESKRIKRHEQSLNDKYDAFTIISEQDAKRVQLGKEIHVVPNGIEVEYFKPKNLESPKYDVSFVGNLGYTPNQYAVKYLYQHIFPFTSKLNLKICISGARPGKEIKSLDQKGFKVQGWVDDIRDAYADSRVFAAPIFGGIGQQNKVLEAMSMQVPCVVSPEVAQGLGITNVNDYLTVASDADDFLKHIKAICIDKEASYAAKARLSREYLISNRSWTAINDELVKLIASLN